MLIEPFSRFFIRNELSFRAAYKQGEALAFSTDDDTLDVHDIIEAAVGTNKANLVIRAKDVVRLTKLEIRPREKIAVLLFRRSDPNASRPFFEHATTRKLRPSDKKNNEALAISAHLFIHLPPIPDRDKPTYPAILEEVPGLSRTYIQMLLNDIIADRTYAYTDRRGEQKTTYTLCKLDGVKSENVGGVMKNASIPYVTLVRPAVVKGLDTGGLVEPREEKLRLVIKAKASDTLEVLKKIKNYASRHHYADVLVRVDLPEQRSRVVSIARQADAADILFVRSEQVTVKNMLDVATETISEELVTKAKAMFAADGYR